MSGHSKWSKVKHQKAYTDAAKGQLFTKASQAITLAVREGGSNPDPESNFKLRLAIDKAKAVNMPKDKIERAIARASGGNGGDISEYLYEGFGPSGSAILIQVLTDNTNRIVSALKNTLSRYEGTLASPGAVIHLFKRVGIIQITGFTVSLDTLMDWAIESGADDVQQHDNGYQILTNTAKLGQVKLYLESQKLILDYADVIYLPIMEHPVATVKVSILQKLIDDLESLEDVVSVYTNAV